VANAVLAPRRVLTALVILVAALVLVPELAHAADPPPAECTESTAFDEYRARGWSWAYLAAFGFGFLTSLTPCVYPMIPIVLGVFGARGEQVSRRKAMLLATLYVVGMGITYATLGVIFALVGGQFGSILANPAVVIPIVAIYALLAASMFGAFDLNLPASWQAKLNQIGGAGYGGAFAMGLVGGFTAAPCTGPFLVGMLGFVAQSGNVPVGGSLLFVYAIGMGVLFWVLAAFAVSLPKSGRWMEWVKSIGGVALLAAGIYFLRPVVPALDVLNRSELWFLGAGVAVTAVGLVLGAIHLSFHDRMAVKARKAFAVLLTVVGVSAVIGWILTPDRHLPWIKRDEAAVARQVEAQGLELAEAHPKTDKQGEPLEWLHPAEALAFTRAAAEGKGVMIDFAADWCLPCKELEVTFADAEVYELLMKEFVHLKIDVSEGSDQDDEFQDRYQAANLPAVLFLDAEGHVLGKVSAAMGAGGLLRVLRPAVAKLRGELPLDAGDPCLVSQR
jgi:thiol:disulfide interchange protein DsbD